MTNHEYVFNRRRVLKSNSTTSKHNEKKNITHFKQFMSNHLFDEIDNKYIKNLVDRIVIVENAKFFIFDIFDTRVSLNNVKQFVDEISIKMIF